MSYETLNPKAAKERMDGKGGWHYVDVRTVKEFQDGHVPNAFNVPIALGDSPASMVLNPDFVDLIKRRFDRDAKLVFG